MWNYLKLILQLILNVLIQSKEAQFNKNGQVVHQYQHIAKGFIDHYIDQVNKLVQSVFREGTLKLRDFQFLFLFIDF